MKYTSKTVIILCSLVLGTSFIFSDQTKETLYDIAIIGSGPAGLTAGIYTSRARFNTIIFEGDLPGGLLMKTKTIENWPGSGPFAAPELMLGIRDRAQQCGCELLEETVVNVNFSKQPFNLTTNTGKQITAHSVIIATGSSPKKLYCPGEKEYFGKGIATCATCDAPFYKDQEVVVVGTGNPAIAEVEHLTNYAKKITVIEKENSITAKDKTRTKILEHKNVSVMFNSSIKSIHGDGEKVTHVIINYDGKDVKFKTDGIFVAIGFEPNTQLFKDYLELGPTKHIIVKNYTNTNLDGIFAAGNVADTKYQQAITCAGIGGIAALDAQKFLTGNELTPSKHWRHQ